ncbi:hypothetical protein QQ008_30385, partial [Fulvivirgaceae bacterium BMA10]|nr:hypothetical protein [Fulvivirgaceae bacterium BMA10]
QDIVLGYYNEGSLYPLRGRECSSTQMPFIKKKFPTYNAFGKATLEEVYGADKMEDALHYQAHTFATTYYENKAGKFEPKVLDNLVQLSSVNVILTDDYNGDGHLDLLMAGNMYGSEVETPRNDASYGMIMTGDGNGDFQSLMPFESGLHITGEVREAGKIVLAGQQQ